MSFGYGGRILRVNLSSLHTEESSTSSYSDRFIGGRGIAAKLYWDEVLRRIASRCWGGEAAADFSNSEGMALAAKTVQDRQYAQDCLILCSFLWPITDSQFTDDHLGDPSLESQLLSAVTGREIDEDGLYRIAERVFNLGRAILIREGHRGMDEDQLPDAWHDIPLRADFTNPELLVPGDGDEAVCRKGAVVDRNDFEEMKREYYRTRGWDATTGLQTRAKLEDLGLWEVTEDLGKRGLLR